MGEIIRIQVHKSLKEVLEEIRNQVATDMKRRYSLEEITVPRTLSSQILAAKLQGKKILNFRLKKVSLNKGILEIL